MTTDEIAFRCALYCIMKEAKINKIKINKYDLTYVDSAKILVDKDHKGSITYELIDKYKPTLWQKVLLKLGILKKRRGNEHIH